MKVRVPRYAVRLALIGCLGWAGWSAATAWTEILSGPPPAAPAGSQTDSPAPPVMDLVAPGLPEGSWKFAGAPVRVEFARLPEEQVAARVTAPPAVSLPPDAANGQSGRALIGLMKGLKAVRRPWGPGWAYAVEQPTLKAALFTRGQPDGEQLVLARLALPSPREGWLIVETEGRPAGPRLAPEGGLLPWPADAQRLCTRQDRQDRLVAEVVSVPATLAQLQEQWRRDGWTVPPTPQREESGAGFLCLRGTQAVQVWAAPRPASSGRLVLIVVLLSHPQVTE